MRRSVSSGDDDGYGARTQMLELEKAGRNSSGRRWSDSAPSTRMPSTPIPMVTRRSMANLAIGLTLRDIAEDVPAFEF